MDGACLAYRDALCKKRRHIVSNEEETVVLSSEAAKITRSAAGGSALCRKLHSISEGQSGTDSIARAAAKTSSSD